MNTRQTVYILDNLPATREWQFIIPGCHRCNVANGSLVTNSQRAIRRGVVVVHRSFFDNKLLLREWCKNFPDIIIISVSGEAGLAIGELIGRRLYYRREALGAPRDEGFSKCWRRFTASLPKLADFKLLEPQVRATTSALAILCQGYLVAYWGSRDSKTPALTVRKALRKMRWQDLAEDSALPSLKPRLKASWDALDVNKRGIPMNPRNAAWWLQPFCELTTKSTAKDLHLMAAAIRQEWEDYPASIKALLKLIGAGKVERPDVVAQAYIDLLKRMEAN